MIPSKLNAMPGVQVRDLVKFDSSCKLQQFRAYRIGTKEKMLCAADIEFRIEQLLAHSCDSFPSHHAGFPLLPLGAYWPDKYSTRGTGLKSSSNLVGFIKVGSVCGLGKQRYSAPTGTRCYSARFYDYGHSCGPDHVFHLSSFRVRMLCGRTTRTPRRCPPRLRPSLPAANWIAIMPCLLPLPMSSTISPKLNR